ncbi:AfsR/SARP family transcriptional regulator [Streptomyces sp. GS7]|uniref:AfsR/SARP family transcriptional regulator n=1 Tax=Streptomyces sp. GS7 TaxID=2692234 RepID=UPI001315E39D|nr:BTAD domain-containing putative transcriptional regulator [Streptomyces sp. GS7]QHC21980.1 tetratricopeptide repeat protein [Streptomyces sp. GS7]
MHSERGATGDWGALVDFDILILGSVELRSDGHRDPLGSAKERLVLAALAIDAGQPVTLDALIHRLWDDNPPAKPRVSLHAYAARIRRRLRGPDGQDHLVQHTHTYTLDVEPERVDYHRYQHLAGQARALTDSGDDERALALLKEADATWRGEALAGLTGWWVENTRAALGEQHLAATLNRIDIEMRRGHFAELVAELTILVERHPTDETLVGHLMVASYGCGRQADALRAYEAARRRLRTELGTDPGEGLARLHRLILRRTPVDGLFTGKRPVAARPVPNNLPSHAELVGREAEMGLLHLPSSEGGVIALQAISGMGGVGKSLLALHAAHRLGKRFPDAQLMLDLRAHSPGAAPLAPEAALTALLRILGVPASGIPQELEELSSLWRTMLSTRRALIILDDAAGPEQLRPLLPGSSPSLIIITSRRRLAGLPGIRSIVLDVLPVDDATELFVRLVGAERAGDPHDVATIVRLCGQLPLALELAAGRLASRPSWTTAHLIQRLSRGEGRLGEFRDSYEEIARTFEMSYVALTVEQQSAFRSLSLHLGQEFGLHAATALTGLPPHASERVLEALLDSHLLQEPAPDRFRFHDLLGEYALTLARAEDTSDQRDRCVARLVDFYLHAADRADRLIYPRRHRLGIRHAADPFPIPPWSGAQEAKSWLAAERTALFTAEHHARTHGRPRTAARLAHALAGFLDSEGYWAEAERMHRHAVEYWRTSGESRPEARALIDLGSTLAHSGRYPEAVERAHQAMALARGAGDTTAEVEAIHLLGVIHWHRGQFEAALDMQHTVLELRRALGDRFQIARSQNNLGITHLFLGQHASSKVCFEDALKGFREVGDSQEESRALNNLSDLHLALGDRDSALRTLQRSLDISMAGGSRSDQAVIQLTLASAFEVPGDLDKALDLYRQALFSFRQLGDRRNECLALNGIGEAFQAAGRSNEAVVHHRGALDLASTIGAAHEQAQAMRCLGVAEAGLGNLRSGLAHLEAAVTLASEVHDPEEKRKSLDALARIRAHNGGTYHNRSLT